MTIQLNGKTPTKIVRWHNGAEQAVKKIVVFPDGVTEKQIRPAGWQPGINTYLYYPLATDANDASGNNRNGTVTGTITYSDGIATFTGAQNIKTPLNNMPSQFTISVRIKSSSTASGERIPRAKWGASNEYQRFAIQNTTSYAKIRHATSTNNGTWDTVGTISTAWHNIVFTKDSSANLYVYLDGSQTNNFSYGSNWGNYSTSYLVIGGWTATQSNFKGNISNFIVEDKVWSAQDVSDYYNLTKGNYGL